MLTENQFREITRLVPTVSADYYPLVTEGMTRFHIDLPLREAAYLATLIEESQGLAKFVENLNYSAKRMTQVWPRRFPTIAAATPYAHNPEKLANKVYANRLGNGPPESGDGWRFRGGGPIQATGKDMYKRAGDAIDVDLIANPELIREPATGFLASAWIFAIEKNCNPPADRADIKLVTLRINGGTTNLAARTLNFEKARRVLGV